MELELRQDYLSCWDSVFHTILSQEESAETIVPDACPDILQILDGEGVVFLRRREAAEGRGEFSGDLQVTVLYQPEGEEGARSLEMTLPFTARLEQGAISRRSVLHTRPQVQSVEVRMANPRKVQVKVGLTLDVTVWQPQSLALAAGAEGAEPVEQQVGRFTSYLCTAVQEKTFTYSDALPLPAGLPPVGRVLRLRPEGHCTEAKVIGSKIVFKGEARITLLYQDEGGGLHTAAFPLPFSQIMDAGEGGEEADCRLTLLFTQATHHLENEGRSVSLDLELLAQAALWRRESRPLLQDLYSTTHQLEAETRRYDTCTLRDQGTAQETVRQILECGLPGESVCDVRITPSRLTQAREGNELVLEGLCDVFVLYTAQGGLLQALHRRLSVQHRLPWEEGAACTAHWRLLREGTAQPAGEGMEVTCTAEFTWQLFTTDATTGILRADLGDPLPGAADGPSVSIRTVGGGESLWDIAKAYATTQAAITQANDLATPDLRPGQLLLIPRS